MRLFCRRVSTACKFVLAVNWMGCSRREVSSVKSIQTMVWIWWSTSSADLDTTQVAGGSNGVHSLTLNKTSGLRMYPLALSLVSK